MKKLLFAMISVALILSMAGCDLLQAGLSSELNAELTLSIGSASIADTELNYLRDEQDSKIDIIFTEPVIATDAAVEYEATYKDINNPANIIMTSGELTGTLSTDGLTYSLDVSSLAVLIDSATADGISVELTASGFVNAELEEPVPGYTATATFFKNWVISAIYSDADSDGTRSELNQITNLSALIEEGTSGNADAVKVVLTVNNLNFGGADVAIVGGGSNNGGALPFEVGIHSSASVDVDTVQGTRFDAAAVDFQQTPAAGSATFTFWLKPTDLTGWGVPSYLDEELAVAFKLVRAGDWTNAYISGSSDGNGNVYISANPGDTISMTIDLTDD